MRPVIQTYTGRAFNLLYPETEAFDIEDIAHALSMLPRFTGHAARQYSVAEHSIHVSSLLPDHLKLAGLLHDATEAYVNDLSSPLKHSGRLEGYKEIESTIGVVLSGAFDIPFKSKEVKAADMNMMAIEAKKLLRKPLIPEWNWVFETVPNPTPVRLKYWGQKRAKREFLSAYKAHTILIK